MYQTTRTLTLMLLALLVPTAWVMAQHSVVVATMYNGVVTPDKAVATAGETITLKVQPYRGFALREGTLVVEMKASTEESDHATYMSKRAVGLGAYVSVTQTADATYTFTMPDRDVAVKASFDAVESTIVISETTTTISSGAFMGQTKVTDIELPDTDEPIEIEPGAFTIDNETGDSHHVLNIHTPLHLLDDYALMAALSENYEAGKISATATAPHQYWSFACGVDVALPEGVKLYIVRGASITQVEIVEVEDAKVIKANNGVLLACPDDNGNAYEMVARVSADRPSGMRPITGNARSYEGNLLEPVIKGKHYNSNNGYYILSRNQFHRIKQEGNDVLLPACKAVLYLPGQPAKSRSLKIAKR